MVPLLLAAAFVVTVWVICCAAELIARYVEPCEPKDVP
jgi:hypothetical protein